MQIFIHLRKLLEEKKIERKIKENYLVHHFFFFILRHDTNYAFWWKVEVRKMSIIKAALFFSKKYMWQMTMNESSNTDGLNKTIEPWNLDKWIVFSYSSIAKNIS